jgi:predicted transcriptional regulator
MGTVKGTAPRIDVLHFEQMRNTLTIRLPEDLAAWLEQTARKSGVSRGRLVRMELERARASSRQRFLRLAGAAQGPANLSIRKGFSKK